MKSRHGHRKNQLLDSRRASKKNLIILIMVFAVLGVAAIYKSSAVNPNLQGDVNDDNKVGITDLSILLSSYATSNQTADFNGDGIVNILDLSILLTNYGKTYTGSSSSSGSSSGSNGGSTANVFVSTNGNDTDNCTQSQPCKTLQRAFSVAQSGQTIEMADGSYPTQAVSNVQKIVTLKAASGAEPRVSGQLAFTCTTGVTVDNIDAKQLGIFAGNDNFTVKNGSYGAGTYTKDNEEDVVVLGDVYSCSTGDTSNGIVLDNLHIHDYFWQQDPGSSHTDCMQFYGGTDGVTIRNTRFERCAESFIGAFPDFGDIRNVIIEDTIFKDLSGTGKGSYYSSQWGQPGHSGTCSGITIRRTTWTPNYSGIGGGGTPLRSDCSNFIVENNTFQYGPGQFACDSWNSSYGGTVKWRNNTFQNGNACST